MHPPFCQQTGLVIKRREWFLKLTYETLFIDLPLTIQFSLIPSFDIEDTKWSVKVAHQTEPQALSSSVTGSDR